MRGVVKFSLWLLLLLLLLCGLVGFSSGGTTGHLKDIFLGRCYDYNLTISEKHLPRVKTECTTLWQLFESAFAYKSSCGLNYTSYFPFLQAAKQDIPANKNLFWSGTNDLAHRMSKEGHSYVTMEDTLMGYLVDSLSWWWERCPEWNDCEGNANSVFWKASSEFFAQEAEGQVSVLLDGSNPQRPAYRRSSMFSSVELPNLDPAKVTSVNILLMHRLGHPKVETCSSGSLVDMKADVMARGISSTCEENPDSVLHLLCSDDSSQVECNIKVVSDCPDGDGNGSSNIHFGRTTWIPLLILLSCLDIFLHLTI